MQRARSLRARAAARVDARRTSPTWPLARVVCACVRAPVVRSARAWPRACVTVPVVLLFLLLLCVLGRRRVIALRRCLRRACALLRGFSSTTQARHFVFDGDDDNDNDGDGRCILYVQDQFLMSLAGILATEGADESLRFNAGLFCKNLFVKLDEKEQEVVTQRWLALDPAMRMQIKNSVRSSRRERVFRCCCGCCCFFYFRFLSTLFFQ